MWRRLFTFCSTVSLLVCLAACAAWAKRLSIPRVGDGWFVQGCRYAVSLSPDQMTILGPPPSDPAMSQQVEKFAAALRASGETLRYNGTTGGMGFGDLIYFSEAYDGRPRPSDRGLDDAPPIPEVDNSCIRVLMAALEEERLFLMAHGLMYRTRAGRRACVDREYYGWMLKDSLQEAPSQPGHWTGELDGVSIDLVEDRPRRDRGSWCDEIWAVVTPSQKFASQRAEVCRRWHERLDVPLGTARYARIVGWSLAMPAASVAGHVARRLRCRKRRIAGQCPACGYDLRGSLDRCPECGTEFTSLMREQGWESDTR